MEDLVVVDFLRYLDDGFLAALECLTKLGFAIGFFLEDEC